MSRARAALAACVLVSCGPSDWRNADVHVDVSGVTWSDTDAVRLCLGGVGVHEEALATGRVAFTGVPVGADGTLLIDLLDPDDDSLRTGRAGPLSLDADTPWQPADWSDCDGADCAACTSQGERAAAGDDSWLVAVRFL